MHGFLQPSSAALPQDSKKKTNNCMDHGIQCEYNIKTRALGRKRLRKQW